MSSYHGKLAIVVLVLMLIASTGGISTNVKSSFQVKESHAVPPKWQRKAAAPQDHILKLRIGLYQGKFSELERQLAQSKVNNWWWT